MHIPQLNIAVSVCCIWWDSPAFTAKEMSRICFMSVVWQNQLLYFELHVLWCVQRVRHRIRNLQLLAAYCFLWSLHITALRGWSKTCLCKTAWFTSLGATWLTTNVCGTFCINFEEGISFFASCHVIEYGEECFAFFPATIIPYMNSRANSKTASGPPGSSAVAGGSLVPFGPWSPNTR